MKQLDEGYLQHQSCIKGGDNPRLAGISCCIWGGGRAASNCGAVGGGATPYGGAVSGEAANDSSIGPVVAPSRAF